MSEYFQFKRTLRFKGPKTVQRLVTYIGGLLLSREGYLATNRATVRRLCPTVRGEGIRYKHPLQAVNVQR